MKPKNGENILSSVTKTKSGLDKKQKKQKHAGQSKK